MPVPQTHTYIKGQEKKPLSEALNAPFYRDPSAFLMSTSQTSRGKTNEQEIKLGEKTQQISAGLDASKQNALDIQEQQKIEAARKNQEEIDASLAEKSSAQGEPTGGTVIINGQTYTYNDAAGLETLKNTYGEPDASTAESEATAVKSPADTAYDTAQTNYVNELTSQLKESRDFYDDFSTRQDDLLKANISAITKKYEARRFKMEDINSRYLESTRISGISSGRQRYAQSMHAGLLSTEEMDGQARLSAIDAEELQLIAEAKQARSDSDITAFHEHMDRMGELNKEKISTLTQLHNAALAQDKLIEEKRKTQLAEQDAELQKSYDTADTLASEVSKQLQGFDTEEDRQEYLNQISADYNIPLEILQNSLNEYDAGISAAELDARGKESLITSREKATLLAQQKEARLAKEKVEKAEGGYELSSTQKSKMLSVGFNDADSNAFAERVGKYGLDQALQSVDGITPEIEESIRSIFSGKDPKHKIADQFLDEDFVTRNLDKDTLEDIAAEYAGIGTWWYSKKEKAKTIKYIVETMVPDYRKQGMSDEEILKILKEGE